MSVSCRLQQGRAPELSAFVSAAGEVMAVPQSPGLGDNQSPHDRQRVGREPGSQRGLRKHSLLGRVESIPSGSKVSLGRTARLYPGSTPVPGQAWAALTVG